MYSFQQVQVVTQIGKTFIFQKTRLKPTDATFVPQYAKADMVRYTNQSHFSQIIFVVIATECWNFPPKSCRPLFFCSFNQVGPHRIQHIVCYKRTGGGAQQYNFHVLDS